MPFEAHNTQLFMDGLPIGGVRDVEELALPTTKIEFTAKLTSEGEELLGEFARDSRTRECQVTFSRTWPQRLLTRPWRPHHTHERFGGLHIREACVVQDGELQILFGVPHRPTMDTFREPTRVERWLTRAWRRWRNARG